MEAGAPLDRSSRLERALLAHPSLSLSLTCLCEGVTFSSSSPLLVWEAVLVGIKPTGISIFFKVRLQI